MYVVDSTFETEVSFYYSHRVLQFLLAYVQKTNAIRFDVNELGTASSLVASLPGGEVTGNPLIYCNY